ncbi:hypothetical protein F4776DRAFT_196628 [Hypoxylon sp. NC0597]|nr:hypothetical protein F4776DRAFT_196628 [Hypoxylon sp. NC0597]
MKPVEMDDVSRGLLDQDSLLLLNISALGPYYLTQIITRDNSRIQSKGGKSFPNEIWTKILKFAHAGLSDRWYEDVDDWSEDIDDGNEDTNDRFWLVKANLVSASPSVMVIRCFRHAFNLPLDKLGKYDMRSGQLVPDFLRNEEGVRDFECYLAFAEPSTVKTPRTEMPELKRLSGPDNTFDIALDTTSTVRYLYASLDASDIIATINHGRCWICRGKRFICPGCTGGIAQGFDVFMGCGVDLACPLCMGTEFSQRHKDFLQDNYWDEPPKDMAEDMLNTIEDRLAELGYADVSVPDGAWKGSN